MINLDVTRSSFRVGPGASKTHFMSSLRTNIAANFISSLWTGLINLLFIPLYIRLMGIEPYGLVGFFLTLQSVLVLLDAGLGRTLNRELARLSASPDTAQQMRRLLRTFELIYWAVAAVAGALIMLLSGWIASEWVKPERLSISTVQQAVLLMAITFIAQWPLALYTGALHGLQQQVSLGVINAVAATFRGGGAVLVLWLVSPTVQAFFVWQMLVGFLQTAVVAIMVWRAIGGTSGATFELRELRSTWRFAAGVTVISVLASVLTQLDKVVLSRMLSLEMFGYYAFAGTVAAGLYRAIGPVSTAIFPRFAQLVGAGAEVRLAALYHDVSQLMSIIVLPAAVFTAFYSHEVLLLWTRDPVTSGNTHLILSLLIVGTALNGILNVPYALQLAYGWTRMVVGTNLVAVAFLVPLVLVLARKFGAPGAAFGWLAYNAGAALVVPILMHRRMLRGELGRWYLHDVSAPLVAATMIAGGARLVLPASGGDVRSLIVHLVPVAAVTQMAAMLAVPAVRQRLFARFSALA